ncbi:hypothetical protein PV08_10452 [Exophiala spinifera]|uniref:NAD(P)-binding protein n=1 Tax=Exophiala spinifera TaxID=91928 RepID=A0A0D1ZDS8_9EURO|nr:uncharacterized protein PV08_10452 [Exophiala spinifera]KIW11152.1 hypothetical protein PV08_10452 [Exophiala spinifera]
MATGATNTTRKYTPKLSGTSVLVIGGTSGIGYGVVEGLIEHKVSNVYISSSRQSRIDSTIARLKGTYPDALGTTTRVTGIACDLGDEATLESNVKALYASIPEPLNHVVFTAGDALGIKPLDDVDLGFFKQCGMVRFFAPFFVTKYARERLVPGVASSVTLTTGGVSEKPSPNWAAITPWMTGLHGMCRQFALDLAPLRVNIVSPGAVRTELWDTVITDPKVREAAIETYAKKMATGQVGNVDDVAESYLYLMKDKNVTGTVIRSDGGAFLL